MKLTSEKLFITFLDPFAFQTVAVVRKNFSGDFEQLRGKKYCHPGFNTNQYWTDRVLKVIKQISIVLTELLQVITQVNTGQTECSTVEGIKKCKSSF